jgi:hypothetical protein
MFISPRHADHDMCLRCTLAGVRLTSGRPRRELDIVLTCAHNASDVDRAPPPQPLNRGNTRSETVFIRLIWTVRLCLPRLRQGSPTSRRRSVQTGDSVGANPSPGTNSF